jgi:hypothetical protein
MLGEGSTVRVYREGTRREKWLREEDGAAAGTIITAPALTTRKRKESVFGLGHPVVERNLHHFWTPVQKSELLAATSPQCQPTTLTEEKDLYRIEHTLSTCFTRFTGRDHR